MTADSQDMKEEANGCNKSRSQTHVILLTLFLSFPLFVLWEHLRYICNTLLTFGILKTTVWPHCAIICQHISESIWGIIGSIIGGCVLGYFLYREIIKDDNAIILRGVATDVKKLKEMQMNKPKVKKGIKEEPGGHLDKVKKFEETQTTSIGMAAKVMTKENKLRWKKDWFKLSLVALATIASQWVTSYLMAGCWGMIIGVILGVGIFFLGIYAVTRTSIERTTDQ
jgi:hypothetical protein